MKTPNPYLALLATAVVAGITYVIAVTAPWLVAIVVGWYYYESVRKAALA